MNDSELFNLYKTNEVSGRVASFSDGADNAPLKHLVVGIGPVQAGSGNPSPTNIRPISGRTGVNAYKTGKNIWYEDIADWKLGYVIPAGGEEEENSAYKYSQTYFPVEPSTQYAMQVVKTSSVSAAFTLIYYDEIKSFLNRNVMFGTGVSAGLLTGTFTTPPNCSYIRLNAPKTAASNIQIEKGNVCTDYEDVGTTFSVDWTSEAGTVYGGTIDIVTGLLTVTKGMVDMGGLSWTKYDSDIAPTGYAFYTTGITDGIRADTARLCSDYWYSDVVGFAETYAAYGINDMLCWSNSSSQRVYLANSNYSDADSLKTSLDGVQLVYTLETPVEYQLTPVQVLTLLGINNVWSDTDYVDVTYPVEPNRSEIDKLFVDGINLEEKGWFLKWRKLSAPKPRMDYVSVYGRDGDIDLTETDGQVFYENRELFMDMKYIGDEWEKDYSELLGLVHGQKLHVQFSNDPAWYWPARIVVSLYDKKPRSLAMSGVAFPYKFYGIKSTAAATVNGATESNAETVDLEGSRMPVSPKVTIVGTVTLKWGSTTKELSAGTYYVSGLKVKKDGLSVKVWGTGTATFEYRRGEL